nr:hypothetical protein 2 [Carajing virus]
MLFILAGLQFAVLLVVATFLYQINKHLPLLAYVFLYVTASGPAYVYLVLAGYWILSKIWFRKVVEPPDHVKLQADPYYCVRESIRPMEKKERDVFLTALPFVEMILFIALAIAIVVSGNKSCFPLLAVIIVVIIARSVPSVGGNSTAGIICLMMVILFSVMMVGPHIYAQWAEVMEWEEPKIKIPVTVMTEDIATQSWLMWDVVTSSIFEKIGLALNYTKFGDVTRCFLGLFVLAFLLFDEWIGPGIGIMAMVQVRLKNLENRQWCWLGVFKSLNWIGLLAELGFCFISGNYTKLLIGCLAAPAALAVWWFTGRFVWVGRGMVSTQIEARTDTLMVFGDGPTVYRLMVCRFIACAILVAFYAQNGAANGFGLLVICLLLSLSSERVLTLFIGFLTMNMTILTMGLTTKKPISVNLTENAQPAADPTYGANSKNTLVDED